jgi:hypothetical protein
MPCMGPFEAFDSAVGALSTLADNQGFARCMTSTKAGRDRDTTHRWRRSRRLASVYFMSCSQSLQAALCAAQCSFWHALLQ